MENNPNLNNNNPNTSLNRVKSLFDDYQLNLFDKKSPTDKDLYIINSKQEELKDMREQFGFMTFKNFLKDFLGRFSFDTTTDTKIKISRTGTILQNAYDLDCIALFDDSIYLGINIVTGLEAKDEKVFFKPSTNHSIDISGDYKSSKLKYEEVFMNLCIPIVEKDFLDSYEKLSKNSRLEKRNLYLLLVKRYYIDPIYKFLSLYITDYKLSNFEALAECIKTDDIEIQSKYQSKYLGVENVSLLSTQKKYILVILVDLYQDFYNNPEVLKLKDLGF